jgi:predicted phosphate transport protein (TIGR00153 family)
MGEDDKRSSFLDRVFPRKYDFNQMLEEQAEMTSKGAWELVRWLRTSSHGYPSEILELNHRTDELRYDMEASLMRAFSTPFDRQDIYSVSRQMDYIFNNISSIATESRAFKVEVDDPIIEMAQALAEGMDKFKVAMKGIEVDHGEAKSMVREIRSITDEVDRTYMNAMLALFNSEDAIMALKKREIYHHFKTAGRSLNVGADILHRIVVSRG